MLKEIKFFKFIEQVKQEAGKVSWPEKRDLLISAAIVVGAAGVVSFVCLIVDYSVHTVISMLLNIGKS